MIIIALTVMLIPLVTMALRYIVPRETPLGVNVPQAHQDAPEIARAWKIYVVSNFAVAIVLLIAGFVTAGIYPLYVVINVLVGIQVLSLPVLWWTCGDIVRRAKREQGWYDDARVEIQASATPSEQMWRMPRVSVPWVSYVIAVVLPLLAAVVLWLRWPEIPDTFPQHYGPDGQPDAWTTKSMLSVFGMVGLAELMVLLMLSVAIFVASNPGKIRNATSTQGRRRLRAQMVALQRDLGLMTICLSVIFMLVSLMILPPLSEHLSAVTIVILVLSIGMIVVFIADLVIVSMRHRGDGPDKEEARDAVDAPDRDEHYILGFIYYNPDDPAIFVDRRFGMGFDVNFGSTVGKVVAVLVVALLIVVPVVILI